LPVCAAAKIREAISASPALSVAILKERSATESTETTANDRFLDFMAQMPRVEPDDQFVAMSWVVIKLQPL
jgi:hypothetical protein